MENFKKLSFVAIVFLFGFASLKAQGKPQSGIKGSEADTKAEKISVNSNQNSNINGLNNGIPNRISMNITVGKQTKGATYGEKVNSGKINVTLDEGGCVVLFPSNEGYRVITADKRINELSKTECLAFGERVKGLRAAGSVLVKGTSILGGALPGGAIISAAVSSVGNLSGGAGGGAAAASYAATGKTKKPDAGKTVLNIQDDESEAILELKDGEYELTFVIVEKVASGLKDTLKTQVLIGFTVEKGVLKTKHDTVKNSVGNIR